MSGKLTSARLLGVVEQRGGPAGVLGPSNAMIPPPPQTTIKKG
jgi:hypothetical protein